MGSAHSLEEHAGVPEGMESSPVFICLPNVGKLPNCNDNWGFKPNLGQPRSGHLGEGICLPNCKSFKKTLVFTPGPNFNLAERDQNKEGDLQAFAVNTLYGLIEVRAPRGRVLPDRRILPDGRVWIRPSRGDDNIISNYHFQFQFIISIIYIMILSIPVWEGLVWIRFVGYINCLKLGSTGLSRQLLAAKSDLRNVKIRFGTRDSTSFPG